MTKEEIIMRGKQLGFPRLSKNSHDNQATMIATIVAEAVKAEREACAKECDNTFFSNEAAQKIRARVQADGGEA